MAQKIFVYGTLRKGMYNYDIYLRDENSFRGYAYIKGSLLSVNDRNYPAYLMEGHDMILGEIHEISDETAKKIDKLEGYFGEGDLRNDYNKIICDIYNDESQVIDHLPVYVWNQNKSKRYENLGDDIPSHDFVQFIQQRKKGKKSVFDFDEEE